MAFPTLESNPVAWVFVLLLIGSSVVLVAKVYGLFFMNGRSPFRVGEVMDVSNGKVIEWQGKTGLVQIGGELWKARSQDALQVGSGVDVVSMNGLVLQVRKNNQ